MPVARVVVDVPSRAIDRPFDYAIPDHLAHIDVGSCVLVDFANRPAIGYVVGIVSGSEFTQLKDVAAHLDQDLFDVEAARVSSWVANEYLCPLSEAVKLFTPPGGTPRAVRTESEEGGVTWTLERPGVGPVDDRWASLAPAASSFVPKRSAHLQRAILDALAEGPVRVAELTADLGGVSGSLKALERAGAVTVESRRRFRDLAAKVRDDVTHAALTEGQTSALDAISRSSAQGGGVVVVDGVTGSGKTEVYLRAIDRVLPAGKTACVLVPEISLTPQTVGRFRARFGDKVAVLHSRLSAGERFDQWDRVRSGDAQVVVGARSALFAPLKGLGIVVIDEEHEPSYKQSSSPRYHAREVAERLCAEHGAVLVLGSASPSFETLQRCRDGSWTHVRLPERVSGRSMPVVEVVDLAGEFASGNRGMFSRALLRALEETRDSRGKAVLFLNRRGFASFVLCRECGHVPSCESCSSSLTYHDVNPSLRCHHCGVIRPLPAVCPQCGSPYLRQFGAGTQRVHAELESSLPGWPVVRMDADTTKGKGAHERLLAEFEALDSGVLLGTQMIAKGLDYPDVTLVGVITADVTLNLPDFRAGERTFQLLEQVAGRAGRGAIPGRVIVQTYWPQHPAVCYAARHDIDGYFDSESQARRELGYPPFGRLVNVHVWGRAAHAVEHQAERVADALRSAGDPRMQVLGPSPSPLSRLKGVHRWHVLVKGDAGADLPAAVGASLGRIKPVAGVTIVADVDPVDLL